VSKVALQANSCYNGRTNIVVAQRCYKHPEPWINLCWRSIVTTLSPHAENGNIPEKRCVKCDELFPATSGYFQVHNRAKDGLLAQCRNCKNAKVLICGVCGSQKSRRTVSGKSRSICKECERRHAHETIERKGYPPITDAIRATKTRYRNKVRTSGLTNQRVYRLKARLGIDEQSYIRMLDAQHGCCAICKIQLTKRIHVDHDHETENVRGLLCERCNIGLGYFSDDPERLRDAALYIESRKVVSHESS